MNALPNVIRVKRLFAMMMMMMLGMILASVGGQEVINPRIPNSPYDGSTFWVDYGLVLENYPEIARTNLSEASIRTTINILNKPIQEYYDSIGDEGVTASRLKSSIIGLLDIFSATKSFEVDEVGEGDYKSNQIWPIVFKRETLSKVLKARNSLYNAISEKTRRDAAISQYQRNLKTYRETMMRIPKTNYNDLVTSKSINWVLYQRRYNELIKDLVSKDSNRFAHLVRGYFAVWLRDGEPNDDVFNELKRNATTITSTTTSSFIAATTTNTSSSTSTDNRTLKIFADSATDITPGMMGLVLTGLLTIFLF